MNNKLTYKEICDVLNALPNPIALNREATHSDGTPYTKIEFLNSAFKESMGYTLEDIPSEERWFELAYPDDKYRSFVKSTWSESIQQSQQYGSKSLLGFPANIRCKDGSSHWFQVTTQLDTPLFDSYNIIVFVQIQTPDDTIIQLQNTMQQLLEKNCDLFNTQNNFTAQYKLIQDIIDTVPVRIFWKDREGKYLGANHLFLQDAQLDSQDQIIGKTDFDMPWGKTEAELYREDDLEVMTTAKAKLNIEETQTDSEGKIIILQTSKVPLINAQGDVIGILGTYNDITQQRENEKKLIQQKQHLNHQAHHDFLTTLPNRTFFTKNFTAAIEQAALTETKVAMLFLDLDRFKEINDSLGHEIGDEVLKIISQRLLNNIKGENTLSRFGGDEFIIMIDNLKSIDDASLTAERIIEVLSQPIQLAEHKLYVSSSIGISIYPDDGTSTQDLLKYADAAMYKAKDEGRNNFQFYNSRMTDLTLKKMLIEANLRGALENREFILYFQPQIETISGSLTGMEVLIRWDSPNLGFMTPDKFIPIAEATGLIIDIDRFVMQEAVQKLLIWHKKGYNTGTLSLNLSMKQLESRDFITFLKNCLETNSCKSEWIQLEVTESQIMKDPKSSIKKLKQISELGIELAIDDFGTGYSSLSYLKKLPISKLKIDKSFVDELPYDEDDIAISQAIIALAKTLKLKTIAEGVETKEQREFLLQSGCDTIQGYLFSKPLPAEEFEEKFLKGQT